MSDTQSTRKKASATEQSTDHTAAETEIAKRDLSSFQRHILTILADEARYGLAIKRELEALYGEEVNHGRLYPNLDRLVEHGFVAKSELDQRTNQYELTSDGEAALVEQLEWERERIDAIAGGDA